MRYNNLIVFTKNYPLEIAWNMFLWICAISILILIDRTVGVIASLSYIGAMILAVKATWSLGKHYDNYKRGLKQ